MPTLTDGQESRNIQQQVFDLFPPYPQAVTLSTLASMLPYPYESVQHAVYRLKWRKLVVLAGNSRNGVYRKRRGARFPVDMRGHHGNSGRRRAQCR